MQEGFSDTPYWAMVRKLGKDVHLAAAQGDLEALQSLLDAGADMNSRGNTDETVLHCAIRRDQVDVVRFVLRHGADINAQEMTGQTPLMFALRAGRTEIVKFLLEEGAYLNIGANDLDPYRFGETALAIAIGGENREIIDMLQNTGAKF